MQWEHRRFFHWEPTELLNIAGSPRMWDRAPGSEMFSVVRVGVGKVKLAMTLELPEIAQAAELEPATGHALRKFVNAQEYVDGMPKAIWLQRFPGLSFVGDLGQARARRGRCCASWRRFTAPLICRSSWSVPLRLSGSGRSGCRICSTRICVTAAVSGGCCSGRRRSWRCFSTRILLGRARRGRRRRAAVSDSAGVSPLRVIVDDHCGTPEDWAGLTGRPDTPAPALSGWLRRRRRGRRTLWWVGRSIGWVSPQRRPTASSDGVLRKQVHLDERQQRSAAMYGSAETNSDEFEDAFYATADQLSADDAERFARTLAPYRAHGSTSVTIAEDVEQRTLLDVLGD